MTALSQADPAGETLPATLPRVRAAGGRVFPLRLDPRTKLLLMGFVAVTELMNGSNYFTAAVAAIPVLLLAQNRQWKLASWYVALFTLGMVAKVYQGQLGLPMSVNMVAVLLTGFVLRLAPAFAMAAYFVATTTASELVAGLGRVGVSRTVTIPVSVIFRFIPTMGEEFAAINDAMRMRGLRLGGGQVLAEPGRAAGVPVRAPGDLAGQDRQRTLRRRPHPRPRTTRPPHQHRQDRHGPS